MKRDGSSTISMFQALNLWFLRLKWIVLNVVTVIILLVVLIWMSIFLYGSFYYSFMPYASHERPVHLRFRTDCTNEESLCSFPSANLSLMTPSQREILTPGQSYIIKLELEMPESYVNQRLGMFMVQLQLYSKSGEVVFHSARSAMMQYKSLIYRTMETLFYVPLLILGSSDQKQMIVVEFTDNHQDDPYRQTIGAFIEVQNRRIEIYRASLKIHAKFSGIRYFLFHWPVSTSIIGIASNFFFLAIITLLSWFAFLSRTGIYLNYRMARHRSKRKQSGKQKSVDDDEDGDTVGDHSSSGDVKINGNIVSSETLKGMDYFDDAKGDNAT